MGSSRKKTLALILTTAIVLTAQPIAVYAEEAEKDEKIEEEVSTITNIMNTGNRDATYSAYFEKHGSKNHPRKEIVIEAKDGVTSKGIEGIEPVYEITDYEGKTDCFVWTNNRGNVTYDFEVEEAGLYNLELLYYTISGASTTVDIGLRLDGEYPFTACNDISLDRYWKDASEIKKDSKDNELKPTQVELDMWVTYPLKDKEGLFNDRYIFYLEK